jgi:hypothetical protein
MSILGKVAKFFIGGAAQGVVDTAGQVADIVERFNPGPEKQLEMEQALTETINNTTKSAREMALATHNTWFDVLVDGLNRLVRPVITVWLTGGMMGAWVLPTTDQVPKFYQEAFWTVLVFWFGGRAVLKDLPNAIKYVRSLK